MGPQTYYVQSCPVCGRPLEIRVEYLGRWLNCDHCGGRFLAADPANASAHPAVSQLAANGDSLLQRAEELLRMSSHSSRIGALDDIRTAAPPG